MTETAELADIVLPATTFLEHDDYYTASGHTFLQVAKAVIEPLAGVPLQPRGDLRHWPSAPRGRAPRLPR